MNNDVLQSLDFERRNDGKPAKGGKVVRHLSQDGLSCQIVYSCCTAEELDPIIREEVSLAEAGNYTLEWKVYDHDAPPNLKEHLLSSGFQPQPIESVLLRTIDEDALSAFRGPAYDVRRIHDADGLEDVATISREIGRTNVEQEKRRLAQTLEDAPDTMSIYVAYIADEPVACGRAYFRNDSVWAALCGGRTKTTHRGRGLYTAILAARIREALARGCEYVVIDALPASETILRRRGFTVISHTQPFVYCAGS